MADMPNKERVAQAAAQCRAVAHLATALAQINQDYARSLANGHMDALVEIVGPRTAQHMEILGDILNGMDAVQPEDDWLHPIFERAHEIWPQEPTNG